MVVGPEVPAVVVGPEGASETGPGYLDPIAPPPYCSTPQSPVPPLEEEEPYYNVKKIRGSQQHTGGSLGRQELCSCTLWVIFSKVRPGYLGPVDRMRQGKQLLPGASWNRFQ